MCNKDEFVLEPEGIHLEYKSALKGIPKSVWDTYSSFANTDGGKIVLGVGETDEGYVLEGVPNIELRLKDIHNILNNKNAVSLNLLEQDDVRVESWNGVDVIVIDVPRAKPEDGPIFHCSLEKGTFKRYGDGDYHCSFEDIAAMFREYVPLSYDEVVLHDLTIDDFDMESFHMYKTFFSNRTPGSYLSKMGDLDFALHIHAIRKIGDEYHPTRAGLLMFGKEYIIQQYFSNYYLAYYECDSVHTWTYSYVTGSAEGNVNLYRFYSKLESRLWSDLRKPRMIGNDMSMVPMTDQDKAVRECLLNSLIHADYSMSGGVVIRKRADRMTFRNQGLFLVPLEAAKEGGATKPRNRLLAIMFSMIGLVERVGSGVNYMVRKWDYGPLSIMENHEKQNVKVVLGLSGRVERTSEVGPLNILELIENNNRITISELSDVTGLSKSAVYSRIGELRDQGLLEREGGTRGRWRVLR